MNRRASTRLGSPGWANHKGGKESLGANGHLCGVRMCEAGETPEGTEVIHLAPLADLLVSIERQLRYGHYCSSKSLNYCLLRKHVDLGS